RKMSCRRCKPHAWGDVERYEWEHYSGQCDCDSFTFTGMLNACTSCPVANDIQNETGQFYEDTFFEDVHNRERPYLLPTCECDPRAVPYEPAHIQYKYLCVTDASRALIAHEGIFTSSNIKTRKTRARTVIQ